MVDSVAYDYTPEEYLESSGVVIPPDPSVITPAIRAAILEGRFETAEARQIPLIVEPGDRVLEIGAGIGFISTLLSRERRVASVLAVEANPNLLDYMERLHATNRVRKVRRLNAVLTCEAGADRATFYLRQDFWMGSLMAGPNPYVGTVEVPTRDLDALLVSEAISLIVCDVEGAEAFLFENAECRASTACSSRSTTTLPASRASAGCSRPSRPRASRTTHAIRRAASCSFAGCRSLRCCVPTRARGGSPPSGC